MLQCWEEEPKSRPRFHDLAERIDAMLVERSDYLCFDLDEPCEVHFIYIQNSVVYHYMIIILYILKCMR